jgi:replicative superfamily II helicase
VGTSPALPLRKTQNVIIAMDTGSGKTHIAVLRMKIEAEREPNKVL